MSLRRYLKRKDDLPDPNGSLSESIECSRAIQSVNKEVEQVLGSKERCKSKCGHYAKLSECLILCIPDLRKKYASDLRFRPKDRADIGRYACHHGITAAARFYSQKLSTKVSTSTVQSIKKQYLEGMKKKRAQDEHNVVTLPP